MAIFPKSVALAQGGGNEMMLMIVQVLMVSLAVAGASEAQVCFCEGYHGGYFLTNRQGNEGAFLRLFEHLQRSPKARVALEFEPYTLERMMTGAVFASEKRSAAPRLAIWQLWEHAPATYEWGVTFAHTGNRGLCVTLRDSGQEWWANVSQPVSEQVPRGDVLVFSAFVKTKASGARLYIDAHSNGDIIPGSVASTEPAPPTGEWQRIELRWRAPPDAKTLFPTLSMKGKAGDAFWFDDVSLRVAQNEQELLKNGSFEEEELTRFEAPQILARLRDAVRKGQVEIVGGGYTQPLWSAHDGEGWVRQFLLGMEAVRRALGVDVRTYACQEGGFISQLPQILTGFGFTGCLFRVHWAPWGEMPAFDDQDIVWEGPDGSRIRCVPRYALDEERGFGWPMTPVEQTLSNAQRAGIERPFVTGFADFLPTEVPYYDPAALEARRLPCWAALGQEIRAEPLREKTLIFSGYIRSTAYRAFIIIDTGDIALVPPGIALSKPDGKWHHVEVSFKVPPGAEVLHPHVKIEGAKGEACFDGLSLRVAGQGGELLRNGSFEVGDPQPEEWSLWRWPNTPAEVHGSDPAPGQGTRSVLLRFEGPRFLLEGMTISEYLETAPQPKRVAHDPFDEFRYRWPWGILGGELQQRCRVAQRLVEAAERAAALTGVEQSAQMGNAWRLVLMASHHDTQSCFPGKFGIWRGPEKDYADLCRTWTDEGAKVAAEVVQGLFPEARGSKCVLTAFNPLPVPRDVVLEWVLDGKGGNLKSPAVGKANGETLSSEVVVLSSPLNEGQKETADRGVRVVAWFAALRPLASESFELTDTKGATVQGTLAAAESASLENESFRLRLTQDRGLVSLFDKSQKCEVLSAPAGYAGCPPDQKTEVHSVPMQLRTCAGKFLSVAELTGRIGAVPYEERILLRRGSPLMEVQTTFDFGAGSRIGSQRNEVFPGTGWNSDWVDDARKLRFILPTALRVERAWCDQAYDVRCAPRSPFWALSWAAGEGAGRGVALLLDRSSGFLWNGEGLQLVLAYGGRFMFGPKEGVPLTGRQRFRFALCSYAGTWEQAAVPALADEFSRPVVTLEGEGAFKSLFRLEPPGKLLLGALYSEGSAVIVRLYNPYTHVQSAAMAVPGLKRAWEADLRGNPRQALPVTRDGIAVSVAPKRLLTLRIQRDTGKSDHGDSTVAAGTVREDVTTS